MRRILSMLFLIPAFCSCIMAQNPTQLKYAAELTPESAHAHLSILASAEYEGRGTGEAGGEKAAAYIAEEFKKLGLTGPVDGSYYQPVKLAYVNFGVGKFVANGKTFTNGKDFYFIGSGPETTINTKEIVFIGYGISESNYDDLQGLDISGKVVLLINEGEPTDANGVSLITGSETPSEWTASRNKRLQAITAKNPSLILAASSGVKETLQRFGSRLTRPRITLEDNVDVAGASSQVPVANISTEIADFILQKSKTSVEQFKKAVAETKKAQSKAIKATLNTTFGSSVVPFTSDNVLGYLEGSDLKDELVVITGHYDHDGKSEDGTIYYGADDNGSGTVGVLEVARAFAKAKADGNGPRRSMLFIAYTAEEKGLLGSDYYTRYPVFPLASTVVNLNMDMIGRIDDKHLRGNHNYIHVIGADKLSSELYTINENANADYTHMELDYMYDDPNDELRIYYRSDQYNFAKHGIPVIFYFSGLHPHYHTPEDTVDKIDFDMMAKRTRLVFHTAWEIANRDQRLVVDSNKP